MRAAHRTDRAAERREVLAVTRRQRQRRGFAYAADETQQRRLRPRGVQVGDDTWIDVGADDLEIVEPRKVETHKCVNDRPGLATLRRTCFEQSGAGRKVDTGSDDEDAANPP